MIYLLAIPVVFYTNVTRLFWISSSTSVIDQYDPTEVAAPVRMAMPEDVPILSAPARSIEIAVLVIVSNNRDSYEISSSLERFDTTRSFDSR